MVKKTPLYDIHLELNGKMVEYAGYYLPIQYSGIIEEHNIVRNNVGLFDVSHMGQFIIEGKDGLKFINLLVSNDITNLQVNKIRYSPMLNENGGIIDDLLIYKLDEEEYMLVVNAANKEKDFKWIIDNLIDDVIVYDASDNICQIAIQGPNSEKVMKKLSDKLPERFYSFIEVDINGTNVLVSRTGYTGEDGFELYFDSNEGINMYKELLKAGKEFEIKPCGLGCRDTLRLEASLPLYGHEMSEEISPLDTGLERFVKFDKDNFIGKDSLKDKNKTRIGLKIVDRGIVREDSEILFEDKQIGITTSGTFLPYLNGAYAMAIVDKEYSKVGNIVECIVRNRKIKAEIISLPFYKR
ncbi:MAG TPA: glycine cleavage system aminomethyltransferase GcvT [Erysipelotrichaceae bacterium]|nr:glycine cleavage system aminomethyltransferase GcvT [Erysipelotrichaceae bacterium]